MPDFGDELGNDVEQSIKVGAGFVAMKMIQDFRRDMNEGKYKEYPGNVYTDISEINPNYSIQSMEDDDYEIFFENDLDLDKAAQVLKVFHIEVNHEFNSISLHTIHLDKVTENLDEAGFNESGRLERLKESKEELICLQRCDNNESRNAIVEMLKTNGIAVQPVNLPQHSLHYYKRDIPKIEVIIDEYIKSHDSMDIDPRTPVNEVDTPSEHGYQSWKSDIADKIYEARLEATNEKDYIKECESRGIRVTEAKDGELMYIHPDGDHLKIRGDTLGIDYTHSSFKDKPIVLDDEAKDMRAAAKALEGIEKAKSQDRDIPNFQNISK